MRGRKRKEESHAEELREKLAAWRQMPESSRPSLRAMELELDTSHQLLSYYLGGLDEWRWRKDLERMRANAKAKGVTVTPADEKRYLAWLRRIEERQARQAAKAAARAEKALKIFAQKGYVKAQELLHTSHRAGRKN